jgi:endonuclease/exonuclease/phosphatase (EEP) superfamily protein YafD
MFLPSKLHHRSCRLKCELFVPDTFGLLCWNVHKNNTKQSRFRNYLEMIEEEYDFMLLQEANFRDDEHFTLPHFAFDAAANLEVRGNFYGVLSASRVESKDAQAFLSEGKESLIGTHKSLLVSRYYFEDGEPLIMLNVHAINFRENQRFNKELERFLILMKHQKGAMIVAGDFNTWNKKRMKKLHELREELELEMVPFDQSDHVKSIMGNHLDFIFYRGFEVEAYSVDKSHGLSDHNPLSVRLRRKK